MKKTFIKILAMMLTVMMLISTMTALVQASELINGNTWRGDEMTLQIEEGDDSYNYMIVAYKPSTDVKQNIYYYETSNHALKKEATGGGAVHLIPVVNTKENAGEWTPDGLYVCGESNFDIMYCCDAATSSEAGVYYKRLNLEDSEYYTQEQAEKLRAILTNCYPYVTIEETKAFLKSKGYEHADQLDRSEIISAVQATVWSIANKGNGDSYDYNKTASTRQKLNWGGYMHEFAAEITNFTDSTTKANYKTYADIGTRINTLRDFLLAIDPVKAPDNQIVITKLEIVESVPTVANDGTFSTTLKVALNNSGSSDKDTIKLDIYVDGVLAKTENVVLGTTDYQFTVDARVGQSIKAVVYGQQDLPRGVYFYAPRPADVDGDGIATSREVSQNLIGVSSGMTEVYADAEVAVPNVTELTVNKTWNDGDNRDGIRPESVTVRLHANGVEVASAVLNAENNWAFTFANIPVVTDDGALINYTVTEDAVAGYEAVIDKYSVTNVHQPELTLVEIEKIWNDDGDRDGVRPESITVRLHADGKEIASQELNAENGWKHSFENLFKYENGKEIVYTITEDAVENYTPTITETENGFSIENYHKPEETFVSVTKIWNDDGDRDGKRPESVTVVLLADGEETEYTLTLSAENDFSGVFTGIPVNNAGKKIEYTVAELDAAPYVATVEGDAVRGFEITNTYVPEMTVVAGEKTWDDENDKDGIRPESITINLLANGEVVDTKTVTAADDWTWTFADLYKYENGEEIVYTITEDAVVGYETVVDGYDVTNVHVPEEIEELPEPPVPLVPGDKVDLEEIEDPEIPLKDIPQTGDVAEMGKWLTVSMISAAALVCVSAAALKTKKRDEE